MKNRFYAFLTHLGLSLLVAIMASSIVFLVWYPAPLHEAIGVTQIFLLLLSVDIIIGPVITFIIYQRGKPSLKFDLTVIALLQIAALSYGMHTVFDGRPAFVVFNVDMFEVTRALDIDERSAKKAQADGNPSATVGWSPRWVGAVASTDSKRRQEIMFSSVQGGADWPQLPELFVPLAQVKAQILKKALPLQELQKLHNNNAELDALLARGQAGPLKWLPLRGKAKDMVVIIDGATADIVEVVNIDPWP
ncbi:MAG: TfpX/TfpZ family type IV pilin accessory protein [Methylovulum sp.]|nr:TfpX/TfpZ family type IV pilin accessory protein [Methylovulum sp.]